MTETHSSIGDRHVVRVIEASRVFGAADRVLTSVRLAARSSRIVSLATRAATVWQAWPLSLQRQASGAALLAAVVVHVGLTMWHEVPPGWFWLILPGFIAAIGALLLAASTGVAAPGERT